MENRIKIINDNPKSHWENINSTGPFCKSSLSLEELQGIDLVNYILSEFEQTSPSLVPIFRERLLNWIENTNEIENLLEDDGKLRDFIYEMF